ncbi:4Fe-4S binding protein [Dendrosporobacter sp. 1207_IL3150]|uniref:4Fe-4S binding protein n=1 Tax=Dendrosporobacter sp. 1207_IL3150 TaxID=3084054 RepID=UPI002FDA8430
MAKVTVFHEYCKSCGLCIAICPNKVLEIGDKANQKGYYTVRTNDESKCTGCSLCGIMCPDLALEISK